VAPHFDELPFIHITSTVHTSNTEQHYSNISTNPFIKKPSGPITKPFGDKHETKGATVLKKF